MSFFYFMMRVQSTQFNINSLLRLLESAKIGKVLNEVKKVFVIRMVGFEHTTFCSQNRRATRLRYIPFFFFKCIPKGKPLSHLKNIYSLEKNEKFETKRTRRDSNPRYQIILQFSRLVPSTTRSLVHIKNSFLAYI